MHGQKRQRQDTDEDESSTAKYYRAFFAVWDDFLRQVEEAAFAAVGPIIACKQEINLPKTYKEAVEDDK